jgi:ribosomal protein L21E
MVKRSRGSLSTATRRSKRKGSKITVSAAMKEFAVGDMVFLRPIHVVEGRLPIKYAGRRGEIIEKRGRSYVVQVMDGSKRKQFITTALHLSS